MKNLFKYAFALMVVVMGTVLISSCSKDDDNNNNGSSIVGTFGADIEKNGWGFYFTFLSDGTVYQWDYEPEDAAYEGKSTPIFSVAKSTYSYSNGNLTIAVYGNQSIACTVTSDGITFTNGSQSVTWKRASLPVTEEMLEAEYKANPHEWDD